MTTPGQHDVVRKLVELARMLDEATAEVARLDEAWVKAKARYKVRFAQAFLAEDNRGSVDARKQEAVLRTKDDDFAMELAEQQVRACKERIRTLRDQVEIQRSLGAAVRTEWASQGSSMHPG